MRTTFLIVGSGANGISPAVFLKQRGLNDFRIITKDSDFGGVWHVSRYPGCITDVHVAAYQLSYAVSDSWTSSHPPAPEMAAYLRGVAKRYSLYDHADFDTEFLSAEWLEEDLCWKVTTSSAIYHTQFLILATGFLEQLKFPNLIGRDKFKGRIFHSGTWPKDYTGNGDTIAVLGTSASGVQIVPELQKVAKQVYVFQRTPMHLLPLNREFYTPEEMERRRANPKILEAERAEKIKIFEKLARDAIFHSETPEQVAEREAIINAHREKQVADPKLREKLTPSYLLGCKRPTRTDLFYPTLQKPNVMLVDEGVTELAEHSVITQSGKEYQVDTVVMATGFHWGGDILGRIKRRDGVTVAEYQRGHRKAYKSVSISGCPNLFWVGGANGAVWNGYAPGEFVAHYMLLVLDYMKQHAIKALEVREEPELEWKRRTDEILSHAPIVIGGCVNYCLDESGHDMSSWPGTMESMCNELSEFKHEHYQPADHAKSGSAAMKEKVS
ncbi:MAG: NAD(P)/FAD-dependent oxidoreductase [Rhodospirillaceae bacterium]|nr:NAD(P)/FAD-dependent oxidoreductase [Rhodospirillaceae bacterium]